MTKKIAIAFFTVVTIIMIASTYYGWYFYETKNNTPYSKDEVLHR